MSSAHVGIGGGSGCGCGTKPLRAGVVTALRVHGRAVFATAINARGDIAGGYQDGSTGGAFLERGGVLTDLGALPGGAFTVALALNSRDQVVGYAFGIGSGVGHAFLYDAKLDPPMQDLNDLIPPDSGIVFDQATGINDRGNIVGIGTVGQFPPFHAFLLSPKLSSP